MKMCCSAYDQCTVERDCPHKGDHNPLAEYCDIKCDVPGGIAGSTCRPHENLEGAGKQPTTAKAQNAGHKKGD
jgi:hypothetical protein